MKFLLLITLLPIFAQAQDCPPAPPMECGPDDLTCPGHPDAQGCIGPGSCLPQLKGENGMICATNCPCGPTQMTCPGAPMPEAKGCPPMDSCIEAKVGECDGICPMHCGAGQVLCPAAPLANGCPQVDSCADEATGCPAV